MLAIRGTAGQRRLSAGGDVKLATFVVDGSTRIGACIGTSDNLVDLAQAHADRTGRAEASLRSMTALIAAGEQGLDYAREAIDQPSDRSIHALSAVRLIAPLQPVALRCCSVFDDHHRAAGRALQEKRGIMVAESDIEVPPLFRAIPAYCKGNHLNIIGPDDVVEWPRFGDELDFELELAAIVGKQGRDVAPEDAKDYIFGYTIYNDISARVPQIEEMSMGLGPVKSKDFDGANILGPVIVTADELDPQNLLAIARIDGREIGRCRAGGMRHDWATIIAYRSFGETMHPGEVIASGAFPQCTGIEHLRFLEPGEEMELEVEGIGILRNRVGPRPEHPVRWPPRLDRAPVPVSGLPTSAEH